MIAVLSLSANVTHSMYAWTWAQVFLELSHCWNVANSPIATAWPISGSRTNPYWNWHIFTIRSIITNFSSQNQLNFLYVCACFTTLFTIQYTKEKQCWIRTLANDTQKQWKWASSSNRVRYELPFLFHWLASFQILRS